MVKSLKDKLREDLEYAHVQGDATNDEFKVVGEGEYEVAEDKRFGAVKYDVFRAIDAIVEKHIHTFNGDKTSAQNAVYGAVQDRIGL